jgi:hypothetical protein
MPIANIVKVSESMPGSVIRGEDLVGLRCQWDSESGVASAESR